MRIVVDPVSDMISSINRDSVSCVHLYGKWSSITIRNITNRFEFSELAFDEEQHSMVQRITTDSLPMPVACIPQMVLARKPNGKFIDALRSMGNHFGDVRFVIIEHHYSEELEDVDEFLVGRGFYLRQISGDSDIFVASLYHRHMPPGSQ